MQLATWIGPAGRVYATDVGEAQLAASCLLVVCTRILQLGLERSQGVIYGPWPLRQRYSVRRVREKTAHIYPASDGKGACALGP